MTAVTDAQLQAVAYLASEIRPTWSRPGIMAALRDVRDRPLWLIARAAVTAAATRHDQHSPAVIAMPGPHWADPTQPGAGHPTLPTFRPDPPKPPIDPARIHALRHAAGHHQQPRTGCPDCQEDQP